MHNIQGRFWYVQMANKLINSFTDNNFSTFVRRLGTNGILLRWRLTFDKAQMASLTLIYV